MKHLKKEELEKLREALLVEEKSLEKELASRGKKVGGDWQGSARGPVGNEPADEDRADAIEELAINVPLVEELELRLHEVSAALKKMDEGTYGICEKTGDAISLARLRANPAARTCVADA